MKKVCFVALFLVTLLCFPVFSWEPVPVGTDVALFFSNFSSLPLFDLFLKNPFIPEKKRERVHNFIKASGFNIFNDISSIQIMLKFEKMKPQLVGIIKGKLEAERIIAWAKLLAGDNFDEIKFGDKTILVINVKNISWGMCFLDNQTIAIGHNLMVQNVLDAKLNRKQDPVYADLMSKISDKTISGFIFTSHDLLTSIVQHQKEKVKKKPGKNKFKTFIRSFVIDNLIAESKLNYILGVRTDDRGELWINYDRPDKKGLAIHILCETSDQKIFLSNVLQLLTQALAQYTPPQEQEEE